MNHLLLEFDELYDALVKKDSEYDGLFFVGVRTTGIFCRVTCPARKPKKENVSFFDKTSDAIRAGFRPCKRCRPMEVSGRIPPWLEAVVEHCEDDPGRNWKDQDIRDLGVDPRRVRRWFLANHGITFHHFLRSRRLARALGQISLGADITRVALDSGYDSLSGFRTAFQQWFGCPPSGARDNQDTILFNRLPSPLGPIVVACDNERVFLLEFADRKLLDTQFKRLHRNTGQTMVPGENELMSETQKQLEEYFEGSRDRFDLAICIQGTPFQEQVWNELLKIGYGETASYEQVAVRIGNPKAQRAVGRANGENRIAIVVPCHRVIRQNGEISGYGGGVRRKEWMLEHERASRNSKTASV